MKLRKLSSFLLITLFLISEVVNISFAYNMERPTRTIDSIGQRDEDAMVDDEAAVGIGVEIVEYRENAGIAPYNNSDGVGFRVIATANTRKGIEYDYFTVPSFAYWFEATEPTNVAGDDSGAWIDIPFGVTFYGGPGAQNTSGVYSKVWVCSNGFLSFDSSSNSSVPIPVPSISPPNTLIAPLWSDLDPTGGSITYHADLTKFVVEWKDVLCKYNGLRQTFEVVILNDCYPNFRGQNRIFLLYQTINLSSQGSSSEISPLSPPPDPTIYFSVGIEDQEGYKGTEPPYTGNIENGIGFQFTAKPFSSPEIRELNILMNKADSYAQVYVDRNPWSVRGHNVQFDIPEPDPNDPPLLMTAVGGTVTLLMTAAIGHIYGAVGGFMWGVTRVVAELGYDYAKQLWQADPVDIRDEYTNPGTDFCYVNASAATYSPPYDYPVDASVGSQIFWVFLDDNNLDHELTSTAQLKYYSNIQEEIITLETSTTLRVYIGTPSTPAQPNGPTSGYVDSYYTYNTTATTPDGDSIYYEFDWNDGSSDIVGPYPSGTTVSASHTWTSTGTYYVKVRAKDSSYETWSDWCSNLSVNINSGDDGDGGGGGGGGGGDPGCPFVYTWNGTRYVIDNNVLGNSEASGGADVEDHCRLEQPLVVKDGKYSLLIKEFEQEHSYIDQVRLMAVDHESDVNVAVSPTGEILTYRDPNAPISVVDNYGENWLNILKAADDFYYMGFPSDYLLINFGSLDISKGAKLVLRDDYKFKSSEPDALCIHVQTLDAQEGWKDVAALRTRMNWTTEIVDLSDHLPDANGELKVRLYFTGIHKIDYVGLDTTKQEDFDLRHANLVSAIHSEEGNVKTELKESDGVYAELVPSQQIELAFTFLEKSKDARTYIIYVKGYYYTIQT